MEFLDNGNYAVWEPSTGRTVLVTESFELAMFVFKFIRGNNS